VLLSGATGRRREKRATSAQLQSLRCTTAPKIFWKIYFRYDFWCAKTCSFPAVLDYLYELWQLLSAMYSVTRKKYIGAHLTFSALNYCGGIFFKLWRPPVSTLLDFRLALFVDLRDGRPVCVIRFILSIVVGSWIDSASVSSISTQSDSSSRFPITSSYSSTIMSVLSVVLSNSTSTSGLVFLFDN